MLRFLQDAWEKEAQEKFKDLEWKLLISQKKKKCKRHIR